MTDAIDGLCPLTVQDALRRAATLAPDLEALVAPDGRVTFADLAEAVARCRGALDAAGVGRGSRVGLCLGNGVSFVTVFLAAGSLGAVVVPLNTRFRGEEIAFVLRKARVELLVAAVRVLTNDILGALRAICPEIDDALPGKALPDLRRVVLVGGEVPQGATRWESFIAGGRDPGPQAGPEDTLLVQFTSGTTGFPKGAMLTHRGMLANGFVSGYRMGLRAGDRFHSARPFFHVAGSTLSILSALQHQATLVTMERFEAAEALRLLEAERCTHFSGNDTMALMLLNHPDRARRRLCLRGAWVPGGEATLRRVVAELGARECVSGYGLSEASPNIAQSCWWEPEAIRVAGLMRVQPGLELRIADPTTGAALAPGATGEIRVRGWSVMQGYLDAPEATARTIDPDGWLLTGDLGRLDADGRLEFVGRLKHIVRVGGENVSPEEVENVLHRHPSVRHAQVVGVPDTRLVEVCVAFVVLNEDTALDPDELISWSREHMAGFKVPRHVWIVESFEAIGMTASAKVQKDRLAEHARALLAGQA